MINDNNKTPDLLLLYSGNMIRNMLHDTNYNYYNIMY